MSLYADNLLIYVFDPRYSLSKPLYGITEFGQFSGFKVNWDKSIIFPLDPDAAVQVQPFPQYFENNLLPLI